MVCRSSRKSPALLLQCTSTFKVYRQAPQDCARDIIKQGTPQAVYVHCRKAHSLNLAFGHACEEFLVSNTLNSLQPIAFSAKRLLAFQECFADNDVVREEMQRRTKLCTLCETLLASRADSLFTFRTAFSVVVQALEILPSGGDCNARNYLCQERISSLAMLKTTVWTV